jgi:hypothetical protein
MSENYLWDRSGEPDPEIERIEKALAPFRWRPVPAARAASVRSWRPLAIAAGVLLAVAIGAFAWLGRGGVEREAEGGYFVESLAGSVRIADPGSSKSREGSGPVRVGEAVECGPGARARLRVGPIGSVALEEESRLRVEREAEEEFRLFLERGTLTASIFAAPRVFQVGTPSGIVVDLGCVYQASVRPDGGTSLEVLTGRVSFETEGRKVYVPAGAACRAWPGRGPGTPVWKDAPADFREAVERVDVEAEEDALALVLATERPEDSLTLWHLVSHEAAAVRAGAFDHLAALAPPPQGVTREGCLARDAAMLEAWKNEIESLW